MSIDKFLFRFVIVVGLLVIAGCPNAPTSKPGNAKPAPPKKAIRVQQKKLTLPKRPKGVIPHFREMADALNVNFQRYDDIRKLHRIFESNGGGVALFDFDGDGWLDIFFTNGCRLPLKTKTEEHSNFFFRNIGGQRFERVTVDAGLSWTGYCYGCAVGDYNNDGFADLYVTAWGRNRLWRNNGDGTFSDVTDETGTDSKLFSSSAAFADVNGDGYLDLYCCNYVVTGDDPPELCRDPTSPDGLIGCSPTIFRAAADVLFLSDGAGGFRDATKESGITAVDGKGLGIVVFRANGDLAPDIYVANDGMPNFLYLNHTEWPVVDVSPSADAVQPTVECTNRLPGFLTPNDQETVAVNQTVNVPRFVNRASEFAVGINHLGAAEASMGIACGDYDADGWMDLFLTHFYTETNTLYRNEGGLSFQDITPKSGLGPPSRMMLGFGTMFLDADNNGWLDLFVANGHVDDSCWRLGNPPYRMAAQLFRNERNGRFVEVSRWAGDHFSRTRLGRGVAVGDIDNDGRLDLVVSHQQSDSSSVLLNDTDTEQKSVIVKLIGRMSNRSGTNTIVKAEGLGLKLVREVLGGGSYQSAQDNRVHIGLGENSSISALQIEWPSGHIDRLMNVQPGHYVIVEDGGIYRDIAASR